jgi:lipopolysaccharide/colanic/teichoic acid biosynthesis glycosyltransferase
MVKRVFDILSALVALVLLIPLLVFIAVVVWSESEGGAFFRQTRIGRNQKPFELLKFRSMKTNATGPLITVGAKDGRITQSGRWLRRTKLDELPQLWNVLVGDMSVVGPRPEVPKYVALYDDNMLKALEIRPGLTDPASIDAFNEGEELAAAEDPEEHYCQVILPRKVRAQLDYANRANLITDGRIIVRTLFRILKN